MSRAVLSLGSNLGDPWAQLTAAVRRLEPVLTAVSSVYRTPPWGPVPQDDFLNIIALVADPAAEPAQWLERCRQLEREARRERKVRWGPRTLDVDVIAVTRSSGPAGSGDSADSGDAAGSADSEGGAPVLSDDPELILPHPRAAERAFVLLPWAEVDPRAELPSHGRVADLLAGLDTAGIQRVGRIAR